MIIEFERIRDVKKPSYGTNFSAGIDFYVPEDVVALIPPGCNVKFGSGIKAKIPQGTFLLMCNRSSVAVKGLCVGANVVDCDYEGEIHIHLFNPSNKPVTLKGGDKVVQFVLLPYVHATLIESEITHKTRGTGGFGSTDDKP